MIKHNLEITFRPKPRLPLVECRTQSVEKRLWRRLFGERQKVVVLFPGDTIDRLEIIEKIAPDPRSA